MKKDVEKGMLIVFEINNWLKRIGSDIVFTVDDIKIITPSMGATKTFEFKLNSEITVSHGKIGKVRISKSVFSDIVHRRQTAMFIACEAHIYQKYAEVGKLKLVKNQNQMFDVIKKVFGQENAHDLRDKTMRYVIEELKSHNLSSYQPKNWIVNFAKVENHRSDIAEIIGSSEKTFRKIIRMQKKKYNLEMIKLEKDLLIAEKHDLKELLHMIENVSKKNKNSEQKSFIKIHKQILKTIIEAIEHILKGVADWQLVESEEHNLLEKKQISKDEIVKMINSLAEAQKIDINKIYILFKHFEKEKINILKDLENW